MSQKVPQSLEGVSETLLIPLYVRARESQRPDAIIHDDGAVRMVNQIDCDFSRLRMQRHDELAVIMRMNKFDNHVRDFLQRNPHAVVVHIGCGLDTRFERVDDGRVEWFDLDLPDVMALRQKLIENQNSRYHTLATSVFEEDWLEEVSRLKPRPFMFVAEGVLPYFEEAHVKSLFLKFRQHFPGCELVCDAHTPFVIWADNLHLAYVKVKARLHWSIKHGKDVEDWGEGIRLLDEWNYYEDDDSTPQSISLVALDPPAGEIIRRFPLPAGNSSMKMTNRWNQFVYRLWAPVYDSTVGYFFLPGRRRAIELLDLQPGERVLLVGVGTGCRLTATTPGCAGYRRGYQPRHASPGAPEITLTWAGCDTASGRCPTALGG